ncbi:MAG: hypothetical protein IJL37_10545 [Bacteroidaceae bacterium]|nr:hypothetical protein [Bacteroidaceae bacterium]
MKRLMFALVTLLMVLGAKAQEPFYLQKEGVKLGYTMTDKKGKVDGYSESTVVSVKNNGAQTTVSLKNMVKDKNGKDLLQQPVDMSIMINDGTVVLSPKAMTGKITEGLNISGESLMLPANITTGTTLNDYSITMGIAGINTTSHFTGVKVVAEETIEVSGHSIPCVVVESTASVKVLGMNRSSLQKTWYGRGIGVVKLETYDNKGRLDTTQTLTSIEGL